ncbi:hypothetical protein CC85DRAFT_290738 [Cutaneotrichosporon oleaginosum]|uniref:Uncharacterized protein n=1 Tax=Cutaneotrichosporon oleaginosum TaxID=879819 RepID=A0A0J0XU84_9TREE|nr:uncharacterized protein CC85DRAFT_290738 [Cutaneotrichosporon oleaginosum]KLT44653.1 hypothetical protein CC85DRAFT_290738 [Cutaneotrichosporon oleaginosum]TXT07640.1 hypothetical protein COLE_04564 [Cutaneotrichosporon oleaginosum]
MPPLPPPLCARAHALISAEHVLWTHWNALRLAMDTHNAALAAFHALDRSLLLTAGVAALRHRAGAAVVDAEAAVARAHRAFLAQLGGIEGMYDAHADCGCRHVPW